MDLLSRDRLVVDKPSVESLLRTAGALLWTNRGLQRYMGAEAAKYRPNLLWRIEKLMPGLAPVLCMLMLAVGVVLIANLPKTWFIDEPLLLVCVVSYFGSLLYVLFFGKARGPARWNHYELTENFYRSKILKKDEHIPGFAYQLTKQIKSMIPEARFMVWPLEQDWIKLDPVLVCIVGDKEYSVLVWDEHDKIVPPQN